MKDSSIGPMSECRLHTGRNADRYSGRGNNHFRLPNHRFALHF